MYIWCSVCVLFDWQTIVRLILVGGLLSVATSAQALRFEPGAGVGIEATSNAALDETNERSDVIAITYVGASLVHNDGPLSGNINASLNKHNYLNDTFDDQRFLKLDAAANWAMVPGELNGSLRDQFFQRPVVAVNSATPNNLQDSNIFTLSAVWNLPSSGVSHFSLIPEFKRFYYEAQATDNTQFSLTGNWQYPMFRLTGIGTNISFREVDYDQPLITDTRFSSLHITLNGKRARSTFDISLGATNVQRDGSESHTGFSGDMTWLAEISRLSKIKTVVASELTDASNGGVSNRLDENGEVIDIQVTTDVIRNKLLSFSYLREDVTLKTRTWIDFREILYSDSPNDRKISRGGIEMDYPISGLLSSGAYLRYTKTRLTQQLRTDKLTTAGFNFRYRHTAKLKSTIDFRLQNKDSSRASQSYHDSTVYYELVYGFGSVYRRARGGS